MVFCFCFVFKEVGCVGKGVDMAGDGDEYEQNTLYEILTEFIRIFFKTF